MGSPALRSMNNSSSRSEKNSPPKRPEKQAQHPREFAVKRTIRSVHSIEQDSLPNAKHSAYASNAPSQALKVKSAVLAAHSNIASMECAAQSRPNSLLNNRGS